MHVLSFLPLTELAVVGRGSGSWHPNAVHARPFNVNLSCRVPFRSSGPPPRSLPGSRVGAQFIEFIELRVPLFEGPMEG